MKSHDSTRWPAKTLAGFAAAVVLFAGCGDDRRTTTEDPTPAASPTPEPPPACADEASLPAPEPVPTPPRPSPPSGSAALPTQAGDPVESGTNWTDRLGVALTLEIGPGWFVSDHVPGTLSIEQEGFNSPSWTIYRVRDLRGFDPDPDAWPAVAAGRVVVDDLRSDTISDRTTTILDITVGDSVVPPDHVPLPAPDSQRQLGISDGDSFRLWFIEIGEGEALFAFTSWDDDAIAEIADIATSLRLLDSDTPQEVAPMPERRPPEIVDGMFDMPLFEGLTATVSVPAEPFSGIGQWVRITPELDHSGVLDPEIGVGVPGQLFEPGTELAAREPGLLPAPSSAEDFRDHLAGQVDLEAFDSTPVILGACPIVFDIQVGAEGLPLFQPSSRPDVNVPGSEMVWLEPFSTNRVWIIDTTNGPLIMWARAEAGATEDFVMISDLAVEVLSSLRPT